jgi:hypothetical protein
MFFNNCTKFAECQPKGVRGVDYTKLVPSFQNMLENDKVQLQVNFSKSPRTLLKSHAYLQCVNNNCAKLEECLPKGVRGVDYTKLVPSFQNMLENY